MNVLNELNIKILIPLKSFLQRITKVDTLLFCLSLVLVYTPIYLLKLEFNTILCIISIALAIAVAIIFSYIIDFVKFIIKSIKNPKKVKTYSSAIRVTVGIPKKR
jgi:hypothetical protein